MSFRTKPVATLDILDFHSMAEQYLIVAKKSAFVWKSSAQMDHRTFGRCWSCRQTPHWASRLSLPWSSHNYPEFYAWCMTDKAFVGRIGPSVFGTVGTVEAYDFVYVAVQLPWLTFESKPSTLVFLFDSLYQSTAQVLNWLLRDIIMCMTTILPIFISIYILQIV